MLSSHWQCQTENKHRLLLGVRMRRKSTDVPCRLRVPRGSRSGRALRLLAASLFLKGGCAQITSYDVVTANRFVGEEGYQTGSQHTQQGIEVFPVIAYTNENGYELESAVGENPYSWTTCDAEIYSFLPTSVTPLQECFEACRDTANCTNFRYVTEFPAVNVYGDQDGIRPDENVTTLAEVSKAVVTQQCELHSSCAQTRTASYPGTTYRLLTIDNSCLDTCFGFSCDYYAEQGYNCELMESISEHCDCSGCKCERYWENKLDDWNLDVFTTTPGVDTTVATTAAPQTTTANATDGGGGGGDEPDPELYECVGFWDKPRDYDDSDCNGNTWPYAQTPSGGDYNFEICPGGSPGMQRCTRTYLAFCIVLFLVFWSGCSHLPVSCR